MVVPSIPEACRTIMSSWQEAQGTGPDDRVSGNREGLFGCSSFYSMELLLLERFSGT